MSNKLTFTEVDKLDFIEPTADYFFRLDHPYVSFEAGADAYNMRLAIRLDIYKKWLREKELKLA